MTRTIVVGGGPAGLAAAYRLVQQPGQSVLLLERAPAFGGLAAGVQHGEYTLDFGPHRLHPGTSPEVLADLHRLLGEELELRPRAGQIRLAGRYLPYPIGPRSVLRLGPGRLLTLSAGLAAARLARRSVVPDSFEAALASRLGKPLYDLFYGPYAEKVWGLPGSQIAADQAERRVNQRGLVDLLRSALGRGSGRYYFYPRGGFGRIPAAYAEALRTNPAAQLACSASVEAVTWRAGQVTGLLYRRGDRLIDSRLDHLIWSAPLPELVRRLDPPAPADLQRLVRRLRYRSVVLCYLALAVPRVGRVDTYYFPERRFPFNRVIEQKNFSSALIPPDRTVLGLDFACDPESALVSASDGELRELVLPALADAGLVRSDQVIEVFSRRFRQAYPIYDLAYRAALEPTLAWLGDLANVWLIGRQGLFLHNNTHHSLLMGYRAADAIRAEGDRSTWPAALEEFATFRVAD